MTALAVSIAVSVAAGLLTTLSPCVLPALPIVVGSAAADHKYGPLALAGGLVIAFTAIGMLLASTGRVLGLDEDAVRRVSGAMLVAAGVVLISAKLQNWIGRRLSPLASRADATAGRMGRRETPGRTAAVGLLRQLATGALLGAVWSPCVGPTLGAAIGLASFSATAMRGAVLMAAFGAGAALPLVATAYASRWMLRTRRQWLTTGAWGKSLAAMALIATGTLVVVGADRQIEAAILAHLPEWWVQLLASA